MSASCFSMYTASCYLAPFVPFGNNVLVAVSPVVASLLQCYYICLEQFVMVSVWHLCPELYGPTVLLLLSM
uniref:Uncharacterized protein n=1 Tax=Arundo donax TaxID=35708 RepID=A0A0A9GHZ2_ARUDO